MSYQFLVQRSSLRWKGEVLDAWIADHIAPGFTHVVGYSANEQRRIARDRLITRHDRRPDYPLQRWQWTRSTTTAFLKDVTGVTWRRSCCAHCPFQSAAISRPEWAQRWRAHPRSGALGLRLEHTAVALNPRMHLFGSHSARDLASIHHLDEAMAAAQHELAAARWALYDVRRTFTGPSAAMRAVQTLAVGTQAGMHRALAQYGAVSVDERYGIHRVWLRPPTTGFPRTEHLVVAAPAGVADKKRPGFEPLWHDLSRQDDGAMCGLSR